MSQSVGECESTPEREGSDGIDTTVMGVVIGWQGKEDRVFSFLDRIVVKRGGRSGREVGETPSFCRGHVDRKGDRGGVVASGRQVIDFRNTGGRRRNTGL